MRLEDDLRVRAEAITPPPAKMDAESLLLAGRTARRRRTVAAAASVALAIGVLLAVPPVIAGLRDQPQPATPQTSCTVSKLPVPGGLPRLTPTAVDPSGRFVTGTAAPEDPLPSPATPGRPMTEKEMADYRETLMRVRVSTPVLWTDGKPAVLPRIGYATSLTDVNSAGVAVGFSSVDDEAWSSVLRFTGGKPERLSTPAGKAWTFDEGPYVNEAGDVVAAGPAGVLLWKAGATSPVTVPRPAKSALRALLDDGTIIGDTYAWTEAGGVTALATPDGQTVEAFAARGDWVAGRQYPSQKGIRWNRRTGEVTDLKQQFPANGVNARGDIVVQDFLLRPDETVPLAKLADYYTFPIAVSDTGNVVVGTGDDTGFPITWSCLR
jgi:hypothetical protein